MKEQRPDLFISEGIESFMHEMTSIFSEDEIRMAALYGSAASGSFICGISDIKLFIVLKGPMDEKLIRLSERSSRTVGQYRIRMLLLTEEEFRNSSDIYALEYLELRHSARIIHGEDLFEDMVIDREIYRRQLEERLRGSINSLRQLLIQSGGKRKLFKEFLNRWCEGQEAIFHALIIMADESSVGVILEDSYQDKLAEIQRLYGVSADLLSPVYAFIDTQDLRNAGTDQLLGLLKAYEQLTSQIDKLER